MIARTGNNISYLVENNVPTNTVFASYLIRLTCNSKVLLPEYLYLFLNSYAFWPQILKKQRGALLQNVNAKRMEELLIPYCSLDIQKKLIEHENKNIFYSQEKVRKLLQSQSYLSTELTHQETLLKKLRQQILQEAIEGKLTADWRKQHKLSPCQGGVPRSGEGVKPINNLPHLKTFRKTLRKNLTPAEAKLWTMLKGKQLQGRKFRRQHSVANYILDFYCPAENLAIELDGEVHNNPAAAECDRERDIFLAYTGIKVLRFENKFVFNNPDGLLAYIQQHFNSDSFPDPSAPSNPSAPSGHLPLSGEEDEHASELLKRIQAEKAQLIKDKKIKKQKPLPPISEEEKPFELPDGWVWCRLGEASHGFQYGTSSKSLEVGEIPVLRMGNIQNGEIVWNGLVYTNDQNEIKKFDLVKGDLLFNRTNSRELVGKTGLFKGEHKAIYAGYLVRFHMSGKIETGYVNLVMNSLLHREWCNEVKTDAIGQSNINATKLSNFRFPLPPLLEQKAIVTKVEKLLTLCDQLETQITDNQTHAKQLMQAVLKEAFSQNV